MPKKIKKILLFMKSIKYHKYKKIIFLDNKEQLKNE